MRRFVYVKGSSSKFWEITVDGQRVATRWGRIGTDGQTKTATVGSPALARAAADKQIGEKLGKGYAEAKGSRKAASTKPTTSAKPTKPTKAAKAEAPPPSSGAIAAPGAKAPLGKQLEVFERTIDHDPESLEDAHFELIDTLAKRLVGHAGDRKVAAALTRVVRDHPSEDVALAVGEAIVAAGAPASALEAMTAWIDKPKSAHWNWMLGASAVLQSEPKAAYAKLKPHLADKAFAERVLRALTEHKGEIDTRFFAAAAQWLPSAPGVPSSQYFFATHAQRPEVQTVLVKAIEEIAAARSEPKWGHIYMMLREIKVPGALPSLLKIVARAAPKGGWELTSPLSAIEELGDPAALSPLQALVVTLKGNAKAAVAALIAALEKLAPKTKGKGAAKSAKPAGEDNEIATKLIDGGLSEERVASILEHVRNRIDLGAKKLAKQTVGESRLGGNPDLPAGTEWPHVTCTKKELVVAPKHFRAGTLPEPDAKGRYQVPLAFIAQIDLADVKEHDVDHLLPAKGMLWFFTRFEITLDEKRERPVLASHVLHVKTKPALVRTPPPATLPEWNRYRAAKPVLTHGRPLPSLSVDPIRNLAMIQSERESYEDVYIKQHDPGIHSLLGWARAAYYRGMPGGGEQALLAIASDSVSGFEFGDCQSIFFCIPTTALAKQDFAKTCCLLDE